MTIVAAAADNVSVTEQPTETVAGVAINPAPAVLVVDEFDNPVEGVEVTASLNKAGFEGSTTIVETGPDGVATFSNLKIEVADSNYEITFNAVGVVDAAVSVEFDVIPAAAASGTADPDVATNVIAGETKTLTFSFKDGFGNAVLEGQNVTLSRTDLEGQFSLEPDMSSPRGHEFINLLNAKTDGNGEVIVYFRSEDADTNNGTVTAELNAVEATTDNLTVIPAAPFEVVITPGPAVNVVAGVNQQFDASVYDQFGNLIEEDNDEFNWSSVPEKAPGDYYVDDSGLFRAEVENTYEVTAEYDGLAATVSVLVTLEPAELAYVDFKLNIDDTKLAGKQFYVTLTFKDEFGNTVLDKDDTYRVIISTDNPHPDENDPIYDFMETIFNNGKATIELSLKKAALHGLSAEIKVDGTTYETGDTDHKVLVDGNNVPLPVNVEPKVHGKITNFEIIAENQDVAAKDPGDTIETLFSALTIKFELDGFGLAAGESLTIEGWKDDWRLDFPFAQANFDSVGDFTVSYNATINRLRLTADVPIDIGSVITLSNILPQQPNFSWEPGHNDAKDLTIIRTDTERDDIFNLKIDTPL